MLLRNYDFFDIYAILLEFRQNPDAPYNLDVIGCVRDVLSEPQRSNCVETNIIRKALKNINMLDRERFAWVYVDNIYTYYGIGSIEDDFCYRFLHRAFEELFLCAEKKEFERLEDLADALHNIPIYIGKGCKNLKKSAKVEFSYYNKKYKVNLWEIFTSEK